MPESKKVKQVRKLCKKFYQDLQEIFDELTDEEYYTEVCDYAVTAQSYAESAQEAEEY